MVIDGLKIVAVTCCIPDGDPEEGFVNGWFRPKKGLEPGETHDDGLDEVDVAERLEGLEQDP